MQYDDDDNGGVVFATTATVATAGVGAESAAHGYNVTCVPLQSSHSNCSGNGEISSRQHQSAK